MKTASSLLSFIFLTINCFLYIPVINDGTVHIDYVDQQKLHQETVKHIEQKYQNLTHQQLQQQNIFLTNKQSTQLLQNNLSINGNNNNDNESKNDFKQMEYVMDDITQIEVTIIENNKQLYQSLKYESFSAMKNILRPQLLNGCDKMNFIHSSKIQAEAIPRCLNNNNNLYPNFIGQTHHGSGKTETFTLY